MSEHSVVAIIDLDPGRLFGLVPSGRASILYFPENPDGTPSEVAYGAVTATLDGGSLSAGQSDVHVRLTLWSDDAAARFQQGTRFRMWLGHHIGTGVVLSPTASEATLETMILELVDEDFYGLWEIAWRVRAVLDLDPVLLPAPLAQVVRALTARHLVEIFVREGLQGDPLPVNSTELSIDLDQSQAWEVPPEGAPHFFLGSAISTGAQ